MNWNEIFTYNANTGILYWKIKTHKSRVAIGSIAGGDNGKGHMRVKVFGKIYFCHRIIYEMFYGPIPKDLQIDHINGIKSDNRLCNLRLSTIAENAVNTKIYKTNTSGYMGVYWHKNDKKWIARLSKNKKRISLGCFDTKEEAYAARVEAEKLYHGEFAQSLCRSA